MGTNKNEMFFKDIESQYKITASKKAYTILRLDGKSFSKYTKGLVKPFDPQLISDFNEVVKYLCENMENVRFAYTQSDEISVLMTDFESANREAWFGNSLQKIVSISASLATYKMNALRPGGKAAIFDSRVLSLKSKADAMRYFIWRQKDCARNAVQMVAYQNFSTKQLDGVSTEHQKALLLNNGINFDTDFSQGEKFGRCSTRVQRSVKIERRAGMPADAPEMVERNFWEVVDSPVFSNAAGGILSDTIPDILESEVAEGEASNLHA